MKQIANAGGNNDGNAAEEGDGDVAKEEKEDGAGSAEPGANNDNGAK